MREEISDLFLLLFVVPMAGIFLYLPVMFFTEKLSIGRKKHGYFCMKLLLLFYVFMPVGMAFLFLENKRSRRGSSFYYRYLEEKEFWILQVLFLFWAIGGILLFLVQSIRTSIQLRWVRKVSILQSGERIRAIQKRTMEELGIKKEIPIYQSDILGSSFLAGIWEPAIYLPERKFLEEELFCVLRHELVHYRSRDVWYRRMLLFIKSFYWINPLIYLFCRYFLDSCELACDEVALEGQKKEVRLAYAKAIFQFANADISLKYVAGFGSENMCERRIRSIGKGYKIGKGISALALSGVMVVMIPIVVYAAAEGTVQIQTGFWHFLEQVYHLDQDLNWTQIYIEFIAPSAEEITESQKIDDTRGITDIGTVIDGYYMVKHLELVRGDDIEIRLVTRDGMDKFAAGFWKDGHYTYVNSRDGGIIYTFKITENGIYDIFIRSDTPIWVTGAIAVK